MPSWKKVIISGSAAELSSLYAPSITGSLQGTSSFAVTASYALTSSYSLASSANQILGINKSGFTITKGTVVHLTGSTNSSDTPYITTASYESDNLSANTLGIAAETITFNSTGYVTTEGVLTGLDVTGYQAGQVVYLGASGSITGSAPIAPLHSVRLGQVVRDSPTNNGSIYVRIDNGYEIGELHDVIDSTTNASYGDLLVKSGSVWTTGKQLTGPYGVTGSFSVETPGASGIILDTDINSDTQSSRLFFKNSGSFTDFSIRNTGQLLVIAASASAGVATGTGRMYISASGEVSIGTGYDPSATRGAALQVSGSINIEEGFAYKQDGRNVIYITPGTSPVTTAFTNTIAGEGAAEGTAYFDQMTAFGYQALYQSSGSDNTAVGYAAGSGYSGSSATLIGWGAGLQAKASNQTAVGENAGAYNTGSSQSAYGYQAGYLNTGSNQTAIGNSAGWKNTATQQTAVGLQAGYLNVAVAQTALGQQAGQSNSGSSQTAVGYAAGFQNSGSLQVAIGAQAGRDNSGSSQTAVGYEAGRLNTGNSQTAIGSDAGYSNSGISQTATGFEAGYQNTGTEQSAFGWRAGYQNTGNNMTAVGSAAGYQNSGSGLTAFGTDTGRTNKGTLNSFFGYQAGYFTTGATINTGSVQSVFLGASTTAGGGNRTNQIVIGYNAAGIGDNSVVLGNSSITTTALRGNVGIGTTTPTKIFEVVSGSTTAYFDLAATAGPLAAVITSDSTKLARFNASDGTNSISVGLRSSTETANAGFGAQNDTFIYANSNANGLNIINAAGTGTADYIKFFAGNVATSTPSMIIIGSGSTKGNVGIGTTTPLGKLTVSGSGGYLSYNDIDAAGNLLVLSGSSDELVRIDVSALSASVNTAVSYGIRGVNDTAFATYGKVTDGFMYASNYVNGLNIINYGEGTKEDYIRFYAGKNADGTTPDLHIQGSGSNKGFIGINKIDPIAQLDVNGNTIISGSLTTTSSVAFKAYTSATSFPGTAAGYLAFDSAGNIITTGGVTAGAAGNNTEIQYNNAGALAGTSAITFDGTTLRATGSFTGSLVGILTGTASFAVTASYVATASYATIKTSGTTIYSADPAAGTTLDTDNSIFIGANAGQNSGLGSFRSIGIGYGAGTNSSGTAYGISIGYDAGSGITGNGGDVICIGRGSGKDTLAPQYSILIGNGAGKAFTGNQILYNNIIIGTNISLPNQTNSGINIGGIIFGTGSYNNPGGPTSITPQPNGRIGIGVVAPRATLDVSGSFHVEGTYKAPSGNTIDSNALIQAGLLYLSNNF